MSFMAEFIVTFEALPGMLPMRSLETDEAYIAIMLRDTFIGDKDNPVLGRHHVDALVQNVNPASQDDAHLSFLPLDSLRPMSESELQKLQRPQSARPSLYVPAQ